MKTQSSAYASTQSQSKSCAFPPLFRETLKCPICTEIMFQPVTCYCSHSFCKDCICCLNRGNETSCVVCKSTLCENPVPNITLNSLIESMFSEGNKYFDYSQDKEVIVWRERLTKHKQLEQKKNKDLDEFKKCFSYLKDVNLCAPLDHKTKFKILCSLDYFNTTHLRNSFCDWIGLTVEKINSITTLELVHLCTNLNIHVPVKCIRSNQDGRIISNTDKSFLITKLTSIMNK